MKSDVSQLQRVWWSVLCQWFKGGVFDKIRVCGPFISSQVVWLILMSFSGPFNLGVFLSWSFLDSVQFSSVLFRCSVMSDSLQTHGLQHARLPCPSPTPAAYSNSCPFPWLATVWIHPLKLWGGHGGWSLAYKKWGTGRPPCIGAPRVPICFIIHDRCFFF